MTEESYVVSLNVYDLSQGLARQLSTTFLGKAIDGIWHTGIVVYGNEYFFGGGIQQTPAGKAPHGTPLRVLDLGVTHVPKDVFEMYLQEIDQRYTAETYSLLTHNCNNFSNEVSQFLVGTTIPEYILNLPNEVMSTPMGALLMPMIQQLETTLKAGQVPQAPLLRPSAVANSVQTAASTMKNIGSNQAPVVVKKPKSEFKPKSVIPTVAAEQQKPSENSTVKDPLGAARSKIQEDIIKEFTTIMATGTLGASEAAALATRKVMQKYGHMNAAQS